MITKTPTRIYLVLKDKDQFEKLLREKIDKGATTIDAYDELTEEIHKHYPLLRLHKNYNSWYKVKIRAFHNRRKKKI
jgi:hypothetical protein